jgi:hypothetical protein
MSTIFGILRSGGDIILEDDCLPNGYEDKDFIIVAFRRNSSGIRLQNEIVKYLPSSMKVYPINNSAQGIYTIGDIIKEMEI